VFLENAGGSQVPKCVMDAASQALAFRWRSELGLQHIERARSVVATMLNANGEDADHDHVDGDDDHVDCESDSVDSSSSPVDCELQAKVFK